LYGDVSKPDPPKRPDNKNKEPIIKLKKPNQIFKDGKQNIPILIIMYETGSERKHLMGIDVKYKRVWVRVKQRAIKDNIKIGDVVNCTVYFGNPIQLKTTSGIDFFEGVIRKIYNFENAKQRQAYFVKRNIPIDVLDCVVGKVTKTKDETGLGSRFFKVNRGELFYIEQGDYENNMDESLRIDLKSAGLLPKMTLLELSYSISSKFYKDGLEVSWLPVAVVLNFKLVRMDEIKCQKPKISPRELELNIHRIENNLKESFRLFILYNRTKELIYSLDRLGID